MAARKPTTPAQDKQNQRLARFKKLMKNYQLWGTLVRSGEANDTIYVDGDEYNFFDILAGVESLPPRQKLAFELICLRDMREVDAAKIMGFDSSVSTPVQQYCLLALKRLLHYHDRTQRQQDYNESHYVSG